MRDHNDSLTADLPEIPIQKRKGRPPRNPMLGPMDAAKRKREQRIRQVEAIYSRDCHEWTEAECLAVLISTRWRGGDIDREAWEQLGRLRAFNKTPT